MKPPFEFAGNEQPAEGRGDAGIFRRGQACRGEQTPEVSPLSSPSSARGGPHCPPVPVPAPVPVPERFENRERERERERGVAMRLTARGSFPSGGGDTFGRGGRPRWPRIRTAVLAVGTRRPSSGRRRPGPSSPALPSSK